ncbi:MAG: YkgJ family cysteine cluster protein [Thermodesulfobacteriota bacterium]|nr:YkgJ family cysteine cluster protein [Thermodesulfobacteriota bacterium]
MRPFDFAQLQLQTQKRLSLPTIDINKMGALLDELDAIFSEAETLIQQNKDGDRSLLACAPGCQDCCVVNVSITLLEGLSISRFLRQLDIAELAQITSKLDNLWCAVRGLEDDERLLARRKCAFLDEQGCCLIYPVRPLFCRSISSTDVELCRAAVTGQVFGESQPVMMHQFQLQLYKTLFLGVGEGLEHARLDGRSFQLCGLVRYLLNHRDEEKDLLVEQSLSWDDIYP